MDWQGCLVLLTGLFSASASPWLTALAEEIKQLQGTWKPVYCASREFEPAIRALEQVGLKYQMDIAGELRIVGDKWKWTQDGESAERQLVIINPFNTPKWFNFVLSASAGSLHVPAIYQLKGDVLWVCIAGNPFERPTVFSAEEGRKGSGYFVMGYRRAPDSASAVMLPPLPLPPPELVSPKR
jgi:uncharacterized protein (TIGR03067 family)